jgi:hypothetical protein
MTLSTELSKANAQKERGLLLSSKTLPWTLF